MTQDYASLLADALLKTNAETRFVAGLDGLSRSGKSTLAHQVSSLLQQAGRTIELFHIDDFITERSKRYNTGFPQWQEYYSLQWETDWLSEHFFSKLRSASSLCLPFYETKTDSRRYKEIPLPPNGVILIEGVFLQREEWRSSFDYLAYLDCPREIRHGREAEEVRSRLELFKERYWKAEAYYEEHIKPQLKADQVFVYKA